ncbi:DUF6879 family protein [Kitasatospora sp. NPDC002551]|uniref:DUF6879 family protein n=1 Tax=unclassified Kitasatospora TaxID=2633591 RepID=UPI00332D7A49
MLDGTEFGRLFESFQHTAFRLETLDLYDVEEEREEFEAFLAGDPTPPEWTDNPWVRSMTDHGKTVARVHVLTSPLKFIGAAKLPAEATPEYLRYREIAEFHAVPFAEYWQQPRL